MQTHPSSSEADRIVPRLLSRLVDENPGVNSALVFTYDGLLRAFSSGITFEYAEKLSAICNQMRQYGNEFGKRAERGEVETLVLRTSERRRISEQLLVMKATEYSGLALTVREPENTQGRENLTTAAYAASKVLTELAEHLPAQAPGVGAPHALMRAGT